MTFWKPAFLVFLSILLLSAGQESCSAQSYGPSLAPTPSPTQGVPALIPSPLRRFQGVQSPFAPFPSTQGLVPPPIFEEPPAELQSALPGAVPENRISEAATEPPIPPNQPRLATQPHFSLGGVVQANYDSNIFIQQTNAQSDVYFVLERVMNQGISH